VYRHVLAALKARPSEAWRVGDNLEWDVAAPQRLGLRGVWVNAHGPGLPMRTSTRPDIMIPAFTEILDAVVEAGTGIGRPPEIPE
jgi:putative hydrolase of the HAD superfamily